MKNLPFFQFYPSDFLLDEKVVLMPNQAVGCYIKLLSHCWLEGSIPSSMEKIAILCGETEETMEEFFELYLSSCFKMNGKTNRLVNPRLELERNKVEQVRKLKSEAGKMGMKSRWNKASDNTVITEGEQSVITKNNYTESEAELEAEAEKDKELSTKHKHKHISPMLGEFTNVKLSWGSLKKLENQLGKENVQNIIEELSRYMASTGRVYSDHYATIYSWAVRKGLVKRGNKTNGGEHDNLFLRTIREEDERSSARGVVKRPEKVS